MTKIVIPPEKKTPVPENTLKRQGSVAFAILIATMMVLGLVSMMLAFVEAQL